MDNRDIIIGAMDTFYGTSGGIIMAISHKFIDSTCYDIRSKRNNEYIGTYYVPSHGWPDVRIHLLTNKLRIITGIDQDILYDILAPYIFGLIKDLKNG